MAAKAAPKRRDRGSVRKRGDSYQVLVYAGVDPLTGKDNYLTASIRDEREVDKIRTRLLAQVDQQRAAATKATLAYTLDAWLEVHEAEASFWTCNGPPATSLDRRREGRSSVRWRHRRVMVGTNQASASNARRPMWECGADAPRDLPLTGWA